MKAAGLLFLLAYMLSLPEECALRCGEQLDVFRIVFPSSGTTVILSKTTAFHLTSSTTYTEAPLGLLHRWAEIRPMPTTKREQGSWATRSTKPATIWIILLLFLSGNIHPNPGPERIEFTNPDELKNSSGLRFFHVNVRSLVNKMMYKRHL